MKNSYLLLHICVILLGFSGVFGKLISLNEGLLTWYRVFFSAIILFFIIKLLKINTNISIKEKLKIAKVGIFITFSWFYFMEVSNIPTSLLALYVIVWQVFLLLYLNLLSIKRNLNYQNYF